MRASTGHATKEPRKRARSTYGERVWKRLRGTLLARASRRDAHWPAAVVNWPISAYPRRTKT
eukprot:8122101-Pyramimonas_sp.AAC.1